MRLMFQSMKWVRIYSNFDWNLYLKLFVTHYRYIHYFRVYFIYSHYVCIHKQQKMNYKKEN